MNGTRLKWRRASEFVLQRGTGTAAGEAGQWVRSGDWFSFPTVCNAPYTPLFGLLNKLRAHFGCIRIFDFIAFVASSNTVCFRISSDFSSVAGCYCWPFGYGWLWDIVFIRKLAYVYLWWEICICSSCYGYIQIEWLYLNLKVPNVSWVFTLAKCVAEFYWVHQRSLSVSF